MLQPERRGIGAGSVADDELGIRLSPRRKDPDQRIHLLDGSAGSGGVAVIRPGTVGPEAIHLDVVHPLGGPSGEALRHVLLIPRAGQAQLIAVDLETLRLRKRHPLVRVHRSRRSVRTKATRRYWPRGPRPAATPSRRGTASG